jgi:tripartite ATP-independent transporter DctM subunit
MAGLVVAIIVLIAVGIPVVASMGVAAAVTLLTQNLPEYLVAQTMYGGLSNFTLLAIPLFILTGEILYRCGGAARLVRFVTALVGWLSGGLGISVVVSTMLFSGLSGSVNADAAAIGSVMLPSMIEARYKREWAAAIVAAAAGTGILIPPSITMIVLGTVANLSISRLFLASLLPAAIIGLSKIIVIFARARFFTATREEVVPFNGREVLQAFWGAVPALVTPVIIIGGILGGVFTATEAAAVAVIYSAILALFYRTMKLRDWGQCLLGAGRLSGVVLGLVAVASILSYLFAYNSVDQALSDFTAGFVNNYLVFVTVTMLIFWVVGALLDGVPALVILVPLFMPLAEQAGMERIHFAIFALAVLGISLVTPPLGTACFVVCGIAKTRMNRMVVPMIPFLVIMFAVMLLLAYVPAFSLWLPSVVANR